MAAAVTDCFDQMTPEQVDALTPADVMLAAMRHAIRSRDVLLAVNLAERAAPYFNRKLTGPVEVRGALRLEQLVAASYQPGKGGDPKLSATSRAFDSQIVNETGLDGISDRPACPE
jgi:hypothetical protein